MSRLIDNNLNRLMGLRYKSHPWHGVDIGDNAPEDLMCFIEMVNTDTVKYEVDKDSGYLRIDRPQKYSSLLPALYGFIPQTYSGENVAKRCNEAINRTDIIGDHDPVDICVLTEKVIPHGDIIVHCRPIGGFRMIDRQEADDKIIAVLVGDAVYGGYQDVSELPEAVLKRMRHYFLTYKDIPGEKSMCTIPEVYDCAEAQRVIEASMEDYNIHFGNM
ncbi:MAG: inorganic pyrophosphatase [Rikenellaceae bacterium]